MKALRFGVLLAWAQFLIQDFSRKKMDKAGLKLIPLHETPSMGVFFIPNGELQVLVDKPGVVFDTEIENDNLQLLVQFKESDYPDVLWAIDSMRLSQLFQQTCFVIINQGRLSDFIKAGDVHTDYAAMQKAQKEEWMKKSNPSSGMFAAVGLSVYYPQYSIIAALPRRPNLYACPSCIDSDRFHATYTVTLSFDRKGQVDLSSLRDIEMRDVGMCCEKCGSCDYDDEFEIPKEDQDNAQSTGAKT